MNEWTKTAMSLMLECEKFNTETEIALFAYREMKENEKLRESDSYYFGFKEAMEKILGYIQERTNKRKQEIPQ